MRLDGGDLVLDLGRDRVREGDVLAIYRPIEVRHPITRRTLRDRFLIGHVRVVQAGTALSLAQPEDPLTRAPEVGDRVEAPGSAAVSEPTAEAAEPTRTESPGDAEVLALFRASLGQPPEARAELYRAYVEAHPDTPLLDALGEDLRMLSRLARRARPVPASPPPPDPSELARAARAQLSAGVYFEPITRYPKDSAPELGFVTRPGLVRSVVVHARAAGSRPYASFPTAIDAQGNGHITLPLALERGDGIEYFVEAVSVDGLTETVGTGTANRPLRAVRLPDDAPTTGGRSRARFASDLVSFSSKRLDDWYLSNETDVLYRIQEGWLYGVRVGFTTLYGQGGTVRDLDDLRLPARTAGFSAGYLELELRPHAIFAVMGRVGVGLNRPDVTETQPASIGPGGQLRFRIGEERGVNLVLAGELLPQLGQRAFVALSWELLRGFPMAAEVHVTNQPVASGDLGVRVVLELGWRISEVVSLALRVSASGRRLDHVGPGGGLSATFDW